MYQKSYFLIASLAALCFACTPEKRENTENAQSNEAIKDTTTTVENEAESELSRIEEEHQLYMSTYADSVNMGLISVDTFKGSARREAHGKIGDVAVTVNYGSPGKRGRVLWNGLVSYDQVWVSGSHWATAVTFDADIQVKGTTVPAGTYAFFTIPGRKEWTLILNKNFDQHLADDYDEEMDVIRFTAIPEEVDTPVQRLTYTIESAGENAGSLSLAWDELSVSLPLADPNK